ncbi:hypothetical protein ACFOD9_12265 [Novosphingobium bradum]|uniref:Uncharacterized protein n=1 Tax=Novosphingobium bradum TaxID=1737444 RepID=A0ABV7IQT1_9SPHN
MNDVSAVEIIWDKTPTRRELAGQLDRIAMPADAKVLMGKLLETTTEVAGKIIEIGRKILAFVLDLLKRYPATGLGALVGLTVTFLLGSVPLLGLVLAPLLGPLLTAFMISQGALVDMQNSAIEKQIALFGAKLDAALANG